MVAHWRVSIIFLFGLVAVLLRNSQVTAKCENDCNFQGYCSINDKCICYKGRDGYPQFQGPSCLEKTCARGISWIGPIAGANNAHPLVECSNKGWCDRKFGICMCEPNFAGIACERSVCLNDCFGNGECITQQQLAVENGRSYEVPWDATKQVGCVCDIGFRGSDCSMVECPTGPDILRGPGNTAGRDCSGRGICDYDSGLCMCFEGYEGVACERQTSILLE